MNSNVVDLTTLEPREVVLLMDPAGYIGAAVALFFIGFFGFFCNLMVIILMCGEKQLWTPLNVILFNLVCSDFSVSVLGNPITLTAALYNHWIFGRTMCVIYGFFMSLLGISSITTLTVLAFERYVMISRPFQNRNLNNSGAIMLIVVIWVYSLCLTTPPLFGWGDYVNEAADISCSVNWESRTHNATSYIVFLFAFGLVVPVGIITFSYLNIIATMKKNTMRTGRVTKAESKVAFMIAVMIVAFLTAWTPYAVLALIIAFGDPHLVSPGLAVVPALVAKSSICYNPLIYVGLNSQFRAAWQKFLGVRVSAEVSQDAVGTQTMATPTRVSQVNHESSCVYKRSPKFLSFLARVPTGSSSLRSPSKSVTVTTTIGMSPELLRNNVKPSTKSSGVDETVDRNAIQEENKRQGFSVLTKFPKCWKNNRRVLRISQAESIPEVNQVTNNVKINIYQEVDQEEVELKILDPSEGLILLLHGCSFSLHGCSIIFLGKKVEDVLLCRIYCSST